MLLCSQVHSTYGLAVGHLHVAVISTLCVTTTSAPPYFTAVFAATEEAVRQRDYRQHRQHYPCNHTAVVAELIVTTAATAWARVGGGQVSEALRDRTSAAGRDAMHTTTIVILTSRIAFTARTRHYNSVENQVGDWVGSVAQQHGCNVVGVVDRDVA